MLIEQLLNRGLSVAAGTHEILLRVLEIVLIESELGLRDADEGLQIVLALPLGIGQHCRELLDAVLVGGDGCLRLVLDALGESCAAAA